MPQGGLQFIQGAQLQDALAATVRGLHRLILLVLLYLWLEFVLRPVSLDAMAQR